TGSDGVKGDTGIDGDKGDTGEGDTGIAGAKGDTGSDGAQGDTGDKGDTGSDGVKGDTGADSTVQGDTGVTGPKGDTGSGAQGDTGDQGDTGAAGAGGGYSFPYKFSTNTTAPPDAAGDIEFDNAVLSSVTEIYVHDTDRNSNDLDAQLDDIGVGDRLMVVSNVDDDFVTFEVTSAADSGTYHTFGVTYIGSAGGFADTENISLAPTFSGGGGQGDTGEKGDTGVQGGQGDTGTQFPWLGAWVTSTVYAINDCVENDGSSYVCITGHTSQASDEPGVGGSWNTYWDLLVEKGEQGDTGADSTVQGDTGVEGDTGTEYPWTGPWVTSTAYVINDCVENNGNGYVCILGHTSSASDEPGVGGSWTTYWDLLVEKGNQGDTGAGGQGDTGVAGGQGDTGVAGGQGDTGVAGGQGDTGVAGAQGDTGVGAVNQINVTVENPTASEDINLGFYFFAITIIEVQAVVVGTSPSVTIDPEHRTARDTTGLDILASPTAITNEGAGQNLTSFDDPTVPADSWIILLTTALSGTVTELTVTIRYTID
ncbi:hypothetical protein LCGC14_1509460, partial [marine sediment metagenome]